MVYIPILKKLIIVFLEASLMLLLPGAAVIYLFDKMDH